MSIADCQRDAFTVSGVGRGSFWEKKYPMAGVGIVAKTKLSNFKLVAAQRAMNEILGDQTKKIYLKIKYKSEIVEQL